MLPLPIVIAGINRYTKQLLYNAAVQVNLWGLRTPGDLCVAR